MIIFLEGCDKTGKSTLAINLLRSGFGKKVIHFEKPKRDWYEEYVAFLSNVEDGTICDRGPLGQFVYGPIMRNEKIDYEKYYNILLLMRARNSIVLNINGSHARIRELFIRDKEDYVKPELIKNICDEYLNLFCSANFPLPVIFVNAWQKYDQRFFNDIINRYAPKGKMILDYGLNYVGLKRPNVLLVGEKLNQRNSKKQFAFPFDFGSSSKLLKACIRVNADVGYTNAYDEYSLFEKINTIQPKKIIAFGVAASKLCNFNAISHVKLPHPAYIARFPDSKKTMSTPDWTEKLLNLIQ